MKPMSAYEVEKVSELFQIIQANATNIIAKYDEIKTLTGTEENIACSRAEFDEWRLRFDNLIDKSLFFDWAETVEKADKLKT